MELPKVLTDEELDSIVHTWILNDVNCIRIGRGHWEALVPIIAQAQHAKDMWGMVDELKSQSLEKTCWDFVLEFDVLLINADIERPEEG